MTGLKEDSIVGGMQLLIPEIKFDSSIAEAGVRTEVTRVISPLSPAHGQLGKAAVGQPTNGGSGAILQAQ
jgi:hypothetical protein